MYPTVYTRVTLRELLLFSKILKHERGIYLQHGSYRDHNKEDMYNYTMMEV